MKPYRASPPPCMTFAHHYGKRAKIRACFSMTASSFFIFEQEEENVNILLLFLLQNTQFAIPLLQQG